MLSVSAEGIDDLLRKLGDLPPQLSVAAQDVTMELAENVAEKLAVYPPPRPGSTYVRTGTLGSGWRAVQSGMTASVENDVSYMPYVQDARHQTWFHRETGWLTYQDAFEEETENASELLERRVEEVLKRVGLK